MHINHVITSHTSHSWLAVFLLLFRTQNQEETAPTPVDVYAHTHPPTHPHTHIQVHTHTLSGNVTLLANVEWVPMYLMPKQYRVLPSGPPNTSNLYSATYCWSAHKSNMNILACDCRVTNMWLSCDQHVTVVWPTCDCRVTTISLFTAILYMLFTWADIIGPNAQWQITLKRRDKIQYHMEIRWRAGIPSTCTYQQKASKMLDSTRVL